MPIPKLLCLAFASFTLPVIFFIADTFNALFLLFIVMTVLRAICAWIIPKERFLSWTRSAYLFNHIVNLVWRTFLASFLIFIEIKREVALNALVSVPKRIFWTFTDFKFFVKYQRISAFHAFAYSLVKICFICALCT